MTGSPPSLRDSRGRFVNNEPRPASGIPAHGTRSFDEGNLVPLQHGARTPRFTDPVAAELGEALIEVRPDLADYPEAVTAWARAEARCLLYADYHAKVGFIDEETGEVRGGQRVFSAENMAQRMRERLGLDPRADAELQRSRAEAVAAVADLEAVRARGRAAIERRRRELGVAPRGSLEASVDQNTRAVRRDAQSDAGEAASDGSGEVVEF